MKGKMLVGVLVLALVASLSAGCAAGVSEEDFDALEAEVDALADRIEIEDLMKTYARSMDALDKDTWLSVFSEDLESYIVYPYGNETPLLLIPFPGQEAPAKQQLAVMCDMMIFDRVVLSLSFLSDIVIDVEGTTATGKDYFSHWEIVDPTHPANVMQGMDGDHWYFQEGQHEYTFAKEDGEWKITRVQGTIYRTEARETQAVQQ